MPAIPGAVSREGGRIGYTGTRFVPYGVCVLSAPGPARSARGHSRPPPRASRAATAAPRVVETRAGNPPRRTRAALKAGAAPLGPAGGEAPSGRCRGRGAASKPGSSGAAVDGQPYILMYLLPCALFARDRGRRAGRAVSLRSHRSVSIEPPAPGQTEVREGRKPGVSQAAA